MRLNINLRQFVAIVDESLCLVCFDHTQKMGDLCGDFCNCRQIDWIDFVGYDSRTGIAFFTRISCVSLLCLTLMCTKNGLKCEMLQICCSCLGQILKKGLSQSYSAVKNLMQNAYFSLLFFNSIFLLCNFFVKDQ